MTAQITEHLIYDGKELSMCSEPLRPLIAQNQFPKFRAFTTACWRGYVGSWEIQSDTDNKKRLYLKKFSGSLESGHEATLETIFPEYPNGVFAHWFSGTVRCPEGKLLDYVHGGYASTYERDLFFEFDKGVLIHELVIENGISEKSESRTGYQIAAFLTLSKGQE